MHHLNLNLTLSINWLKVQITFRIVVKFETSMSCCWIALRRLRVKSLTCPTFINSQHPIKRRPLYNPVTNSLQGLWAAPRWKEQVHSHCIAALGCGAALCLRCQVDFPEVTLRARLSNIVSSCAIIMFIYMQRYVSCTSCTTMKIPQIKSNMTTCYEAPRKIDQESESRRKH